MAASSKSSRSKNGNSVIIALSGVVLAILSIFTQWGTAIVTPEELTGGSDSFLDQLGGLLAVGLTGGRVPISGETSLPMFSMSIPVWIFPVFVAAGSAIAASNLSGFSSIPKIICLILCGIGAAYGLWMVPSVLDNGIGIGALLFLAACVLGIIASLKTRS